LIGSKSWMRCRLCELDAARITEAACVTCSAHVWGRGRRSATASAEDAAWRTVIGVR
jgi:hypothetical protein